MYYYKQVKNGKIASVEAKGGDATSPGFVSATKEEYDAFIASLPPTILPEPVPPLCTHWAVVDAMNPGGEKPITVKRTWQGREYTVNCYVTESVKDQYLAGDIIVGNYVLVEFLDDDPDKALVFAKVLKTW